MGWWFLFGGLAGTVLSLVVHWWWQRQRLRADLVIAVATWMDVTYRYLNRMWAYKMNLPLSGGEANEEFRQDARDLAAKLKSLEALSSIELVCGKGNEFTLFEELGKSMDRASVRLIHSLKDTGPDTTDKLEKDRDEVIRLRKELLEKLICKAGPHNLLLGGSNSFLKRATKNKRSK